MTDPDPRARGRLGETLAAAWYAARGYRILARGWRVPGGELDLVAARGDLVVFVEVKTRGPGAPAPPEAWVLPRQRARLRRAARAWLASRTGPAPACRFDVVGVRLEPGGRGCRLRQLPDAF